MPRGLEGENLADSKGLPPKAKVKPTEAEIRKLAKNEESIEEVLKEHRSRLGPPLGWRGRHRRRMIKAIFF